jgi:UDP-glucose 4-epimerase
MRILITGGAGYIGSVIAEELVARGHEVAVYDNLSKGHRDAVCPGAAFVQGDVLDGEALGRALRGHGAEAVVHMAADSLVGESVGAPARYYRSNVTGGLSLLDAMRAVGVARIVFSSTAAVYGEPNKPPIDEDDPLAPTNPYGETKLAFERALGWYERAYGLRHVSLRYFNAAGATERCGERHDPETHLVPLVLRAALGEPSDLVIFGDDYPTRDGTCVRDYIHVRDLARAHVLALEALASGPAPSRVYNLGCGGDGYTVREVIDAAREITGRSLTTRTGPRRPGDPAVLVAGSSRIRRELGFRPAHQDLGEIIGSAWRWMLARRRSDAGSGRAA